MNRANTPPVPATYAERIERAPTRLHALHEHNRPGSKLLRRFYKAKHHKRGSYKVAKAWYAKLES